MKTQWIIRQIFPKNKHYKIDNIRIALVENLFNNRPKNLILKPQSIFGEIVIVA